ncbi:hypothetical protein REPUB_Repub01dG0215400 [Reevesia pubescens]
MPMVDQNRVVMGFPADYRRTTSVTTTPDLEPCNDPDQNLHPCLKYFISTLIVIFFLFFLLAFSVFYLTYRAPIIQIESITPSNITSSSNNNNTNISTNWHLTFSLDNPNKYASIHYKKIQVSVFDKDKRLSSAYVDNFYQDKSKKGRMNVDILGLIVMGTQKINDAGEMVFTLKLDAVVWFETKSIKTNWHLLEANCGDVRVRPSMRLTLDGSGRCNVNLQ